MDNEKLIWDKLIAAGMTPAGAAGLMGNLYAESGLEPENLQNACEAKLGFTDAGYTVAVDNGVYADFAGDGAGYGLAQWTYWSRKAALLAYAKTCGLSVGSLEMQLGFLMQELSGSFKAVLDVLTATTSVREASDIVLTKFECPADQSDATKAKRAGYSQTYYDKFAKGNEETMSSSALVTYTNISPNRNSPRTHAIDTITIHCIVGQWTAKQGCDYFAKSSVQASANYVVGKDGSIGLCVDEGDRSLCSSNAANDHRAVTIEVASDTTHPYAVTDAAYNALIELVADICKRNGIKKLLWQGDKSLIGQVDKQNMTVHRWFANKACPGDYLYERHGAIAEAVNKKLGAAADAAGSTPTAPAASTAKEMKAAEAAQAFDKTLAGAYTVTAAAGLHIRNGAGTGKASMVVLPKGTKVQNYGYYTLSSGVKWLYVQVTYNGVTYTGFCSAQYLSK